MKKKDRSGRDRLRDFVARIESLNEDKRALGDDIKAVYAEAKSSGLVPKVLRAVVTRRGKKPNDLQEFESLFDLYLAELGMSKVSPLFTHVGLMDVDLMARDSVISAFKRLVPKNAEIIVKMGSKPLRLWRDDDGDPQVEDFLERPPITEAHRSPAGKRTSPAAPAISDTLRNTTGKEATSLGAKAARAGTAVASNPFRHGDHRRARWEEGYRGEMTRHTDIKSADEAGDDTETLST